MGIKVTNIPFGEELDQGWRPKRDIGTIAQQLLPWFAALAAFFLVGTLTHVLQCEWPESPFFWILRQLGRALLAVAQILLGVVVWCFSGSDVLFRNLSTTVHGFNSEIAPGPLFAGLLFGRPAFRVLDESGVPSRTAILILVILKVIIILSVLSLYASECGGWLKCLHDLIRLAIQ